LYVVFLAFDPVLITYSFVSTPEIENTATDCNWVVTGWHELLY